MSITQGGEFRRTDVWREGKWLDLWSVVHFLTGISMGLGLFFLHLGTVAAVALSLLSLITYEMWETIVGIIETPANRFMDIVVGMVSFLPAFFLLAPRLSGEQRIFSFGVVCIATVVMSVFGWLASQKAAALEKRMRARYAAQRTILLEQKAQLRERFRR